MVGMDGTAVIIIRVHRVRGILTREQDLASLAAANHQVIRALDLVVRAVRVSPDPDAMA